MLKNDRVRDFCRNKTATDNEGLFDIQDGKIVKENNFFSQRLNQRLRKQ